MLIEEALNQIHKHVGNGLTDAFRIVNKIYNDHEAQLKAKDERIAELNDKLEQCRIRNDNLIADVCCIQGLNRKYKEQAKQARSIVAMLFWHMKRDQRIYRSANRHTKAQAELYYFCSKDSFTHAYKMLKEIR